MSGIKTPKDNPTLLWPSFPCPLSHLLSFLPSTFGSQGHRCSPCWAQVIRGQGAFHPTPKHRVPDASFGWCLYNCFLLLLFLSMLLQGDCCQREAVGDTRLARGAGGFLGLEVSPLQTATCTRALCSQSDLRSDRLAATRSWQ